MSLPILPISQTAEIEPSQNRGLKTAIWAMLGLVLFLTALITVVVAARYLRHYARDDRDKSRPASVEFCIAKLRTGNALEQTNAAEQLVAFGPSAVQTALGTICDEESGNFSFINSAVRALADQRPEAAKAIATALHSPEAKIRVSAANVLREMGARNGDARDDLLSILDDNNRWVRWFALDALGNEGAEGGLAVPKLAQYLADADAFTRRRAITALGHIGPPATSAEEALKKIQNTDADASVRRSAADALRIIHVDALALEARQRAPHEVKQYIRALGESDSTSAVAAAKCLASLSIQANAAVPSMARALRHSDPVRRAAAASALGHMGIPALEYQLALEAAAHERDPAVRNAAAQALDELGVTQVSSVQR